MGLPLIQRPLTIAGGEPPGSKPTALFQMTLQEFKSAAGVDTLQFYKGAKGTLYCPTGVGTLFIGKDYNAKSKVQTVIPGIDHESGNPVFRLTNQAVAMEL